MLAPLDSFHEQVVAVPRRGEAELGVRCGWHGDLNQAPEGFHTELACFAGEGPRRLLDEWAAILLRRHGTRRPSRYADDGVGRLSYWTDNGAAYWYRSEPGLDVAHHARAHRGGAARSQSAHPRGAAGLLVLSAREEPPAQSRLGHGCAADRHVALGAAGGPAARTAWMTCAIGWVIRR